MNKVQQMIQQLCPEGVEYRKLGEVAKMQRGTSVTQKDVNEGNIPVISGGQQPAYYCDKPNREGETITVAGSGAGAGYVAYWICPIFVCDAFSVKGIEGVSQTKYLFHVLRNMQNRIYNKKIGAGIPHVHIKSIENFEIPVPPLPIQSEIVSILDKFTQLEAELEAQLEAELECRKRQYEHYRDKLLAFEGREDVEWKKLGEVCEMRGRIGFRGYTRNDLVKESEGAITLSPSNIVNNTMDFRNCSYISWFKYDESPEIKVELGDIIFTKTASVGKTAIIRNLPKEATINPQLVLLKNIKCNNVFLSYLLSATDFQMKVKQKTGKGSVPNVSQSALSEIEIPVPPIAEQQEIARILDKFTALTTDISQGLPAEIAARRQQYEYYRNQLLSFNRKQA